MNSERCSMNEWMSVLMNERCPMNEWMSVLMNEWFKVWVDEKWTSEWMIVLMSGWMNEWFKVWVDEQWTSEWMNEWVKGWMNTKEPLQFIQDFLEDIFLFPSWKQ